VVEGRKDRVYHNIYEKSTLGVMKRDLKDVGGIYAIVHNETKKLYIGSSMYLDRRIVDHIYNNNNSNIYLQNAIAKHGLKNFSVYILELLPTDEGLTSEELSVTLIKLPKKKEKK
jgi:group I intron endonuclease